MSHWFSRNWLYAIISLCALSSIGLIEASKRLKYNIKIKGIFERRLYKDILKNASVSILIYLSFSSIVITGIESGNTDNKIKNEEVQVIGWISENVPIDSKFLLYEYDYPIRLGIMTSNSYDIYYIDDIFPSDYNYTELINEIEFLMENEIEYLIVREDYLSETNDEVFFVNTYLIPHFYNDSLYESDNYELYYAPYFD
jgi:hypothetical protein